MSKYKCPHITEDRENMIVSGKDKVFSFSILGVRFTLGFSKENKLGFSFGVNFTRFFNFLKKKTGNDVSKEEIEEKVINEELNEEIQEEIEEELEEILTEELSEDEILMNDKDAIIIKTKDNIATFVIFGLAFIISTDSKNDSEINFDGEKASEAVKCVKENLEKKDK